MGTRFGQFVIGPPGSGKTTYCHAMGKLLEELGRKVCIVNIDPACESTGYDPAIDIAELIRLEEAMDAFKLGPNGALMYCMEFLERNYFWLERKMCEYENHYFIFDCPGQIELFTYHNSLKNILEKFERSDLRLAVVQLVDSHHCGDPGKFISTVLMALSSMLQLGMPQVNILSKIDMAQKYNHKLMFNIDFYTEVLDLNIMLEALDENRITKGYSKLNSALVSLIEDFGLVSFRTLNVKDKKNLLNIRADIDMANGYVFGIGEQRNIQAMLRCAASVDYRRDTLQNFGENTEEDTETTICDDLLWS